VRTVQTHDELLELDDELLLEEDLCTSFCYCLPTPDAHTLVYTCTFTIYGSFIGFKKRKYPLRQGYSRRAAGAAGT
jgi:hypothetical protein